MRQNRPGQMAVGVRVPVGRMDPAQMEELARLADEYGNSEVRADDDVECDSSPYPATSESTTRWMTATLLGAPVSVGKWWFWNQIPDDIGEHRLLSAAHGYTLSSPAVTRSLPLLLRKHDDD